MKKTFLLPFSLLIIGAALLSCKKDYTCSCLTQIRMCLGGVTTVTVDNYTIENATKDQARAACNEAKIT